MNQIFILVRGGDVSVFKEKVDNFKQALVKVDGNGKKSVENLAFIGIILIITIVAINFIWNGDKKSKKNNTQPISSIEIENESNASSVTSDLEQKLKAILEKINGVGEVNVLLTYSQTNSINPIYNEDAQESVTEETDTSGGKRTISSTNNKKEVVYSNNNIITQSVTSPAVLGAIVTAKGAADPRVKNDIIQAVSAATGLSTYKIQVFEMI